jgi:DnaJ-class molecular chaperone
MLVPFKGMEKALLFVFFPSAQCAICRGLRKAVGHRCLACRGLRFHEHDQSGKIGIPPSGNYLQNRCPMVDGCDAGKDITVDFRAISNEIHVNRRSAQWVLCQDASTNHWRFVPHSLGPLVEIHLD